AANLPGNALQTALIEGRCESEGLRVRKDGSRFWAHVIIDPIRSDFGALIGYAKVTRDITERRNANEALQKAQEALFHSQKLEAIGKLTGGVAHDFNNLLGVIMNGLLLLRTDNPNPQHFKVLESMERAVNQGATLTRQLLTFARQQPLVQGRHDLNRVLASFESVLRRALTSGVRFDMQLAQSLAPVLVDAQQFEAALLNLFVNAKDATDNGGLITLKTEMVDLAASQVNELPAGRYVKVSVADTGHGMPPEVIKKAIEPFFTTKPVGKGTGLGLSQVYGLIKQSSGDITIESKVGFGCTIALYFPALDTGAEMPLVREENEKVLIVDDQPDILDIAVELFRTLGYEVLSANNGEDALQILQREPNIDVLFSDVFMPGISGIELATQARAIQAEIKIILASGYPDPALRASHANLNEFDFVAKPYRISDIVKKLRMA
ncbi:MAG TPA: response regulator, partial [Cellvibrio sp.]|nr:response regulator [Cellvibrio sp.]